MTDDRGQKTEVRRQMTDDRGRKQMTEGRRQMTDRWQENCKTSSYIFKKVT